MSETPWIRRVRRRPPPAADPTIFYDPKRGETLMVTADEDVPWGGGRASVWAWQGTAWAVVREGLFPYDDAAGTPTGCFDPSRETTLLFQVGSEGVIYRASLDDPEAVERLSTKHVKNAWPSRTTALYDTKRGRVLLCLGGRLLAIDGDKVKKILDDEDNEPMSLVWNEDKGVAIGLDVWNDIIRLTKGKRWETRDIRPRLSGSGLVWDPSRGKVLRLMTADEDVGDVGDGRMVLYALGKKRWKPLGIEMRPYVSGATLGIDPSRQQVLSFGGQDFRSEGDLSNETWYSREGGDLIGSRDPRELSVSRHLTLCRSGARLVAFNHSRLCVERLQSDRWQTVVPALGVDARGEAPYAKADFYDLSVNFTASAEAYFLLDGHGAVWRALPGGAWERFAPAEGGPGGYYARRTAVVWDETSDALVVFGGPETNSCFRFEGGRWTEVRSDPAPRPGIASAVSTPGGVFLLAGHDLWRLQAGGWLCVGSDPDAELSWLLYDPTGGGRLLAVDAALDDPALFVWHRGGWKRQISLPEGTAVQRGVWGGDGEVGLDPDRAQLLLIEGTKQWSLPLAALELPAGDLPAEPVEPRSAVRDAPPERIRRALALDLVPGAAPKTPEELGLATEIPADYELVALLPLGDPPAYGEAHSAAITLHREPWELEDENAFALGGAAVKILLRSESIPAPLVAIESNEDDDEFDDDDLDDFDDDFDDEGLDDDDDDDDHREPPPPLVEARVVSFQELDPEDMERFSSPAGRSRAGESKLGGHPHFIQEEEGGYCATCGAELVFFAQLAPDIFGSRFGDAGSLYAFICPQGHEAQGVAQSA